MALNYEEFLLNEKLQFQDKKLFIGPEIEKNSVINTKLGKDLGQLRVTTLSTNPPTKVYSVYSKNSTGIVDDQLTSTDVLKMLKGQSDLGVVDEKSLHDFLNRASILVARLLWQEGFDLLMSVESSSSLVNDFMELVVEKLGTSSTKVKQNSIFKINDPEKITVDPSKLSPDSYEQQRKILIKTQKDGYFSIKKFKVQFRQFIHGWLTTDIDVVGKKVFIFDDYSTSGSTLTEASHALLTKGAKHVSGVTILK